MLRPDRNHPALSALRMCVALLFLVASVARGASVIEIRHQHQHEHAAEGQHHESPTHGTEDRGTSDSGSEDSQQDPGKHSHLLTLDSSPMVEPTLLQECFIPVRVTRVKPHGDQSCSDGPTFELLKPPQLERA